MRYCLSLLLLCLIPSLLTAQVSNVAFIGSVETSDGQTFSYKLQFSDSNGIITGYSITDMMGPNETKTLVTGSINSNQKSIRFKETKVVYTKTKLADKSSYLCYLYGNLKVSRKKGTTVLRGSFTGYQEDRKTECSQGKILLVSAKDVMDLLIKTNAKEAAKNKPGPPPEVKKEPEPVRLEIVRDAEVGKIAPGAIKEIIVSGPTAKLTVWDAKTIDGDVISILHNGRTILNNYTINGTYKDLSVSLRSNVSDTLKIIAVDEGRDPLNTARIKITSDSGTEYVDASTTTDKPVWIILRKK